MEYTCKNYVCVYSIMRDCIKRKEMYGKSDMKIKCVWKTGLHIDICTLDSL